MSSQSPTTLRPKIDHLRSLAAKQGRDPQSIKVFATFTPILGRTDEEAWTKYELLKQYASTIGGLVLFSGWTGIDISQIPLDQELSAASATEANRVRSVLESFTTPTKEVPAWTPRAVAERTAFGGLASVTVGSAATVADEMELWCREADVDGFNVGYVTTPGSFEDLVDLLVPELRARGLYPELPADGEEGLTAREKIHGKGQRELRDDHVGSRYKYEAYQEDPPFQDGKD